MVVVVRVRFNGSGYGRSMIVWQRLWRNGSCYGCGMIVVMVGV